MDSGPGPEAGRRAAPEPVDGKLAAAGCNIPEDGRLEPMVGRQGLVVVGRPAVDGIPERRPIGGEYGAAGEGWRFCHVDGLSLWPADPVHPAKKTVV